MPIVSTYISGDLRNHTKPRLHGHGLSLWNLLFQRRPNLPDPIPLGCLQNRGYLLQVYPPSLPKISDPTTSDRNSLLTKVYNTRQYLTSVLSLVYEVGHLMVRLSNDPTLYKAGFDVVIDVTNRRIWAFLNDNSEDIGLEEIRESPFPNCNVNAVAVDLGLTLEDLRRQSSMDEAKELTVSEAIPAENGHKALEFSIASLHELSIFMLYLESPHVFSRML